MRKSPKLPAAFVERSVRMVLESQGQHASQWAAIVSIAAKPGCTAATLRRWVCQAERLRHVHCGTSMPSTGGGVHPIAYVACAAKRLSSIAPVSITNARRQR